MHIIGGILLIVVVFGVAFFVYTSGVLEPVFGPLGMSLGIHNSTSTASNNSQYYKEVEIRFVALGGAINQPMTLVLKGVNSATHQGITLTGWSLQTNKGTYAIPKVANLCSPSVPGVALEDIYLRSGDVVNFYSGKNPQGNQQAIRSSCTNVSEWQIWLGAAFLATPHGAAVLHDEKGKVVDEYKY